MNRNRDPIQWQFTRTKAHQKFGYRRNNTTRSEDEGRKDEAVARAIWGGG
jgi:hypothetical protein